MLLLVSYQIQHKKKRGRPSLEEAAAAEIAAAEAPEVPRKQRRVEPPKEVHYDGSDHRFSFTTPGKCSFCKTGFCETECKKYDVRLCIKKKKNNCFDKYMYHYL
ncbi:PiggyBac transposable element-derived protein 4 [Elysia marginata]|uniref:PiggyBac transposable element-derived protein 4 n=1 Tax=Elysia marginata TaxID=1093978 RepID=A0AAV4GC46_9GAST|nr:PiggyBac transposable element-derived protein 4 [Elysia marginata]